MAIPLLAWGLAGLVGVGSVTLYLAAFFFPEVHRRHDFFWSGVGCFYALILWLDATQVTPTALVGHAASVSLMGWLGWQTLTLRRKRTPLAQQTPYTANSWPTFRREITDLALDLLRQTPLRRWLPLPSPAAAPAAAIRISALKEVGYEFVDPVEAPEEPPAPKRMGSPAQMAGSPPTPPDPTPSAHLSSPPSRQPTTRSASPATQGMTLGQRVQGFVAWVQDVVRAKTAPKPKKAVIEIPPRPSSLAKRGADSASPPGPPPGPPTAANPPAPADARQATASPAATPAPPTADTASSPPESSNWDDDDADWI